MVNSDDISRLLTELDGEIDQRRHAQAQLLQLGQSVVLPLLELLETHQGRQAWAAAEILGKLAHPQAFQPLVAALRSNNPLLEIAAVKALLHFDNQDVAVHLIDTLPHVKIMTQQSIIIALQKLNDRRAVPGLMAALSQTESPVLRTAILQTLGQLGDPAAIPAIQVFQADDDHHVRNWAAAALRQITEKSKNDPDNGI